MKKNIGSQDRWLRFFIGVGLLLFALYLESLLVMAIALFVFYEAIFGWCLVYQILGKNSCPK